MSTPQPRLLQRRPFCSRTLSKGSEDENPESATPSPGKTMAKIDHHLMTTNTLSTLSYTLTPNHHRPGSSVLRNYSTANSRADETKESIECSPFAPLGSRTRRRGSLSSTPISNTNNNNNSILSEGKGNENNNNNNNNQNIRIDSSRFQQRENPVKVLAQCSAGSSKLPPIRVDFGGPLSCELDVKSPSHFGNTTQNRLAEWNKVNHEEQNKKYAADINEKKTSPSSSKSNPTDRHHHDHSATIEAENEQDDLRWEERRHLINFKLYDFGPQSTIFRKLFLAEDVKARQKDEIESKVQRRREQVLSDRVPPPEEMPPIPEEVAMELGLGEVIEIEKEQWKRWSSGETGTFEFSSEEMNTKNQKRHGHRNKKRTLGPSPSRTRYIEAIKFMKEHEREVAEQEKQKSEDDVKKRAMMALRGVTQIDLASIDSPQPNDGDSDEHHDDDDAQIHNIFSSNEKQNIITAPPQKTRGRTAFASSSPHATFILDDNATVVPTKTASKKANATFLKNEDLFFESSAGGYQSNLKAAAKKADESATTAPFFDDRDVDVGSEFSLSGEDATDSDDENFGHDDIQKIVQLAEKAQQQQQGDPINVVMKRIESTSILRHHDNNGGSGTRKKEVTLFTPDLDAIPHFESFGAVEQQKTKEEKAICTVMGANFVFKDSDDDDDKDGEVAVVASDGKVAMVKKKGKSSDDHVHARDDEDLLQETGSPTLAASHRSGFYFLGANALHKRENRELFGEFADEIMAIEEADERNRVQDDDDGAPTVATLPPSYSAMVMNLLKTVHLSRPDVQQRGLARTMQQRGCEENVKRRRENEEKMSLEAESGGGENNNNNKNHTSTSISVSSPASSVATSAAKKTKPHVVVVTQRELRNRSILEEALNDLNQVSANAYIDEVTDKAIFFRHALLSEKKARAGLFDDHALHKTDQERRPLILNSHSIRKKAGALTGLFGEKSTSNGADANVMGGNFSRATASSSQHTNKKQIKASQIVLKSDFNPSKIALKQKRSIPVGTELEIGGVKFLYDEFMRQ